VENPALSLHPRILVAGVGNIFLGDDAFGVEVARRLAGRPQREGVCTADFGIRGLDLAYTLLEDFAAVVIIDAMPRGNAPGTLYVLEPELDSTGAEFPSPALAGHSLDPIRVLNLVEALGGRLPKLFVVGCEPRPVDESADFATEMSPAVRDAIDEAVPLVESLVQRILQEISKVQSASPAA
jgi:hydrogenase maturation protease